MTKEYYEVIVEGSFELIKGFVLGYLEGSGIKGEAIFGEEHHVENESKFGQLLRILHVKDQQVHLIIGAGIHALLEKAVTNRLDELKIKLISVKKIREAHFEFTYKAFNREFGESLKNIFGKLPEGLRMAPGYEPKEKILPEGKGIEAYAPLHEYEIKAMGKISGSPKAVIDFYGEVEHNALVELDPIKLEY
jgi:hypothetical protein